MGATLEGIKWYMHTRKGVDDFADMASEAPSDDIEAFQYSGTKVFSLESIDLLRKTCCPPKWRGELYAKNVTGPEALEDIHFENITDGRLWVWAKPDTSVKVLHRYLVAVDLPFLFLCYNIVNSHSFHPLLYVALPERSRKKLTQCA